MRGQPELFEREPNLNTLRVTLDMARGRICLLWENPEPKRHMLARVVIEAAPQELKWELHHQGVREEFRSGLTPGGVRSVLDQFRRRFPVDDDLIYAEARYPSAGGTENPPQPVELKPGESPWR